MQQRLALGLSITLLSLGSFMRASSEGSPTQDPRVIGGRTYGLLSPRSADSNTALKFMPLVYKPSSGDWVVGLDTAVEYTRSFDGKALAQGMFGSDTLIFEGIYSPLSQNFNRNSFALVADYFGLAPSAPATRLTLNPRIENINLHVQSYAGFDCWLEGLYAQVNFTFSHQKRNLFSGSDCQDAVETGTGRFPAGYMSEKAVAATTDLKAALGGDFTFGDMQTPWKYGKFKFASMDKNAVAGVDLILGYDFWKTEAGSLGIYAQYTAPTGNKACADFVFSPLVGNGKHHEIGAGLRASCKLWENDCDENLYAYVDGHVTSLLKNHQLRSFDFIYRGQNAVFSNTMSRYALLKELTPNNSATQYNYAGQLINAINFTTRNVAVRVPAKGDATLRFIYTRGSFDLGFGYNIYGHSHEKIGCLDNAACNTDIAGKTYGLKGANGTYYFRYLNDGTNLVAATPFAKSTNATASTSAIMGFTPTGSTDETSVDNHVNASEGNIGTADSVKAVDWTSAEASEVSAPSVPADADSLLGTIAIVTAGNYPNGSYSNPAIPVTTADLDKESGKAPRQLTHKGFVTMNYSWKHCGWAPYFGVGAEVEGGRRPTDLKQWGVWVKGGFSF